MIKLRGQQWSCQRAYLKSQVFNGRLVKSLAEATRSKWQKRQRGRQNCHDPAAEPLVARCAIDRRADSELPALSTETRIGSRAEFGKTKSYLVATFIEGYLASREAWRWFLLTKIVATASE